LLFAVCCLLSAVCCLLSAVTIPIVDSSQTATRDSSKREPLSLGKLGEAFAAAYLEQTGYRLVAANFMLPVGRNLRGAVVNTEIDLVAYARAAAAYRNMFGLQGQPYRYDVVTIVLSKEEPESIPRIELLRNFWTEASTRKHRRQERFYE
jgi:hypothetical protein